MTYAQDIIIRPIVTEQSMDMMQEKKYTFEVKKTATKIQVAQAIEQIFGVTVAKVTTQNYDGKEKRMGANVGRRSSWKKAIVKLTEGSKEIEFFEGML